MATTEGEKVASNLILHRQSGQITPMLGGLRYDPFHSYPIPWTSELPGLVDHYLQYMAVDIPDLDGPNDKGLLRKSWCPFIMAQEAPFAVVILTAASQKATTSGQSAKTNLLQLRVKAIESVQRILEAPSSCLSDHAIAAVAKFASYEAMYGDKESYRAHMQGLRCLIALRGGIVSLGLNGLLARMIYWIDNHGAFITGTDRFFTSETETSESCIGHFLAMS